MPDMPLELQFFSLQHWKIRSVGLHTHVFRQFQKLTCVKYQLAHAPTVRHAWKRTITDGGTSGRDVSMEVNNGLADIEVNNTSCHTQMQAWQLYAPSDENSCSICMITKQVIHTPPNGRVLGLREHGTHQTLKNKLSLLWTCEYYGTLDSKICKGRLKQWWRYPLP